MSERPIDETNVPLSASEPAEAADAAETLHPAELPAEPDATTDAEASADEAAIAEESVDTEAPASDEEDAVKAAEPAADEEPNPEEPAPDETPDADEIPLCRRCMEQPAEAESDYCTDCAAQMRKIRIPAFGWIGGLLVLVAGLFALILSFLNSAPALQIARADASAHRGNWQLAYQQYRQTDGVVSEVRDILNNSALSSAVQLGSAMRARTAIALDHTHGALDAYSYLNSNLSETAMARSATAKALTEEYDLYQAAYTACGEPISQLVNGLTEAAPVLEQLAAIRAEGKVSPVYLDYFAAALTSYYDATADDVLEKYAALDQTAKESGRDYRWLYYERYITLLQNAGELTQAEALVDEMLESDPSNTTMLTKKMKFAVLRGDLETAGVISAKIARLYGEDDPAALAAKVLLLRCKGEFEQAEQLVSAVPENATDNARIELLRQQALIHLINEDYDEAFDAAYDANYTAYYLYQYYGDDSGYSEELDNTLYVCAYLCQLYGTGTADYNDYVPEVISSYAGAGIELSAQTQAILNGEKTVQQVLMEGVYDLA